MDFIKEYNKANIAGKRELLAKSLERGGTNTTNYCIAMSVLDILEMLQSTTKMEVMNDIRE